MGNTVFILAIISTIVIGAVAIFFTLYIIRSKTRKNKEKLIDILETDKNGIISPTMLTEFNKVKALINNDTLKRKYKKWQKTFEDIRQIDLPKITDMLIDLQNEVDIYDNRDFYTKLSNAELEMFYIKAKAYTLKNEIENVTKSEERNRTAVTKLKTIYRTIMQTYSKSKLDYKGIDEKIELQFENIDKLFSAFELAMEKNEYDEVNKIVKALDEHVNNMALVIEEAPSIMLLSKIVIPKKIKDIITVSKRMQRNGYNIEYLNIDYNIEETNKKLSEIMDKLNVLNIEDSIFELKTLVDYYDGLYKEFDKEKISKIEYEKQIKIVEKRLDKLLETLRNIYTELADLKISYDLTDDELELIDNINKEAVKIKDDFKEASGSDKVKIFPYSKLNKDVELVCMRLYESEDKLENTLRTLGSLKDDELRAREQLEEIKRIMKAAKYKINDYKLPVIPKKYYVELKEAGEAVEEICKELEKKPISIKVLNTRVDTARDLVLKLYNTANEQVKTAAMAEMTIVYGNRYRSTFKDVDNGLSKAEKEFYKGEYKSSLEIVLNTLNVVEPGIHKKLLSEYDR